MPVLLIAVGRKVDPFSFLTVRPLGRENESTMSATTTVSGITLRSCYRPADAPELDYERDLGDPGSFPYTRGTRTTGYQAKKWTVRQVMGLGTGEETNERLRHLLREGQTGISLTGLGYASFESRDPRAAALVGRGGVWVDTLAD